MSGDLSARLDAALRRQEQHEDGVRPDPAVLAELHARVARARRGRTASYAAVAAAAVGVLGVAGWFGLRHDTTPLPAHTPTPAPSATPTPTPGPTTTAPAPESTPPSTPVSVAGMPPLLALPDGALDAAGPGWTLLGYGPLVYDGPARQVLALSAPTGELYLVREDERPIDVVRWDGGRAVRATSWLDDGAGTRTPVVGEYDLVTGELVPDDRISATDRFLSLLPSGDELWFRPVPGGAAGADGVPSAEGRLRLVPREGEPRVVTTLDLPGSVVVSPDGARAVVEEAPGTGREVVDLATGARTPLAIPPGRGCDVVAWLDATSILATCRDDVAPTGERQYLEDLNARVVRFDVRTGGSQKVRDVVAGDLVPARGRWLQDGSLVVGRAPLTRAFADCFDVCWGGAYLWSAGSMTPVTPAEPLPDDICSARPGGDGLLVRTGYLSCYEEPGSSSQVWSVDLASGAVRPVGPTLGEAGALGVAWAAEPGDSGSW
ncbi:hypothetical protein [Cellulomonas sp. B6]|uniref:hypothetical protein n=1 Tax=Cellulomonas sp. B6 TaxID=1295626 RepID=UPI00073BD287|nr:hypothetical protein [Cellulomonas sp. B6]KSW29224.1 hypothetical protein ATM99_09070 [Cellulomonas sp. B6]